MIAEIITKEDLAEFKNDLIEEIKTLIKKAGDVETDEWLRSSQVRKMLQISPGTLQNLRVQGKLHFTKVGSIFYYKREGIEHLLEGKL